MTQRAEQQLRSGVRTPAVVGAGEATCPEHVGDAVGSPEHLHAVFGLAASAADRSVGSWLAHQSEIQCRADLSRSERPIGGDLQRLRALVRASATAYARRLRDQGVTPERMLVLVKVAAAHPGSHGFAARELTNEVVRWSIEAYFDD